MREKESNTMLAVVIEIENRKNCKLETWFQGNELVMIPKFALRDDSNFVIHGFGGRCNSHHAEETVESITEIDDIVTIYTKTYKYTFKRKF